MQCNHIDKPNKIHEEKSILMIFLENIELQPVTVLIQWRRGQFYFKFKYFCFTRMWKNDEVNVFVLYVISYYVIVHIVL